MKVTRTTLYRPFLALSILLGVATIALDIVVVSYFYVHARDEYNVLESNRTCPTSMVPICCSALRYLDDCANPPAPFANETTCIDTFDWRGSCCTRSDKVGLFYVVVVLFFLIFCAQIVDLLSKFYFCKYPTKSKWAKGWEVLLSLAAVAVAVALLVMSQIAKDARLLNCYAEPRYQMAYGNALAAYKDLFNLSIAEVVLTSILFAVDMAILFDGVKPSEKAIEKSKSRKFKPKPDVELEDLE